MAEKQTSLMSTTKCLALVAMVIIQMSNSGLFVLAKSNRVPQFNDEMTPVAVDEEKPPGVHITRATAVDYDGDKIQYSIEDDVNGFFTINSDNGEVLTAKKIDRETLPSDQLSFNVIASEVERPDQRSTHIVHVIVNDVNDNPPKFPEENTNQTIMITENTPHDTFVKLISAKDADINELFYSFESGNERCGYTTVIQPRDSNKVTVLDSYSFEVIADADTVTIVQSRCSNTVERTSSYQLGENPYSFEVIADADTELLFNTSQNTIENKHSYKVLKYFKIDFDTGRVMTNKKLDYETKNEFVLKVAVMDGRPNEQGVHKAYTNLYIKVIDEDDNGAKFDSNYTVSIIEGNYKGVLLTQVHAEDQDKGINKPVHYKIERASMMNDVFSINKNGYVFVNGEIDREKCPIYVLQLKASEDGDGGYFAKHKPARASLTVVVTDLNDNEPEFSPDGYIAYMTEHEDIGYEVLRIKATDKDEGINAQFQYRLVGVDSKPFHISQEGVITVKEDVDREKKMVLGFKVQAIQDGFLKPSSAPVTIIIRDKNDHTPIFDKDSYHATIPENSLFNSTVLTVTATDQDDEKNGQIRYSIGSSDDDSTCFIIHPDTGNIRLSCQLDREYKENYSFLVKASDQSLDGNQRFGHAQVKIKVQDLNDNFPVFTATEYYKSINYDEDIGATILKLTATDKDAGSFGEVYYRIRSGNQEDKYQINKETGALLVGSSLADLSGQSVIEIEAYDNNGERPTLQSNKNAYVTIKVEKKGFNSVVLNMRVKTAEIVKEKYNIESELQALLDVGIKTDDIQGGEVRDTTKYIFHAYNKESFAVVKWDEVQTKLKQNLQMTEFIRKWNVTYWEKYGEMPEAVNKAQKDEKNITEAWTPIIYAVLGFSALIVIFGIFGIVYLIRSRRRYEDGGTSQTSSRVPFTARNRSRSYWNDPGFESVSQINTKSYVHSSGFLSRSCDKYELDPSNLYNKEEIYNDDPFSVIIERPPSSSRSSDDNSSHASSGFAASSVMTEIYRPPNPNNNVGGGGNSQPLLHRYKPSNGRNGVSPHDRRLSMIVDEDGNSKKLLDSFDTLDHRRPPSYEYDFDEKVPDEYDD